MVGERFSPDRPGQSIALPGRHVLREQVGRVDARPVTVRGARGTFGVGTLIRPHLYWREGGVLLTLSGPFPAETLVQVADSLAPVTASR